MNKVIDKGFRSCRFVSTIVKHPISLSNTIRIGSIVAANCFCVRLRTTSYIYVLKSLKSVQCMIDKIRCCVDRGR